MQIRTKRIYEKPSDEDGTRVLVDRVWPRGLSKDEARVHHWLREIAPSTGLRKWFGHDPEKWREFRQRYFQELNADPGPVRALKAAADEGRVTLVYAAKDEDHNNAVALKEYLDRKGKGS